MISSDEGRSLWRPSVCTREIAPANVDHGAANGRVGKEPQVADPGRNGTALEPERAHAEEKREQDRRRATENRSRCHVRGAANHILEQNGPRRSVRRTHVSRPCRPRIRPAAVRRRPAAGGRGGGLRLLRRLDVLDVPAERRRLRLPLAGNGVLGSAPRRRHARHHALHRRGQRAGGRQGPRAARARRRQEGDPCPAPRRGRRSSRTSCRRRRPGEWTASTSTGSR